MSVLRTWQRQHRNGITTLVLPMSGMGSWEIATSTPGKTTLQRLRKHFALLTEAQAAADRHACAVVEHDCSLCEQWTPIERRKEKR